jgi:hypothetical protein
MQDNGETATKQDLREAVESITHLIRDTAAGERAAFTAAITAAEERAQEFARNIETNLLTAFHGHSKGQNARLHTAEVTAADLAIRITALEERVLNIETRRPPH